jgi:hypothetical protein
MNHKELTLKASRWLKKHSNNTVIPNCREVATEISCANATGEIADVIGWCSWTSVLIEVKVSRSDFKRDSKKIFREYADMGMGEFRYYICPTDLIKIDELPPNWGLLYYSKDCGIKIIQKAERQQANLQSERTLLLSLLRRKNKK